MFYHDGYELNPLCDKISKIFKSFCRMIIIRLVLERQRHGRSFECFPIDFGQFFIILRHFEKNLYFGSMTVWQYEGNYFTHIAKLS